MNKALMCCPIEQTDKEHLELRIGMLSLIAARENKFENLKNTDGHHFWAHEDRILDGYFDEFQHALVVWNKRYGGSLTVGQITEFEERYNMESRKPQSDD